MQLSIFHTACSTHGMYGMTCADLESLRLRANDVCELCGRGSDRMAIDHDHAVGQGAVRGLLCPKCNAGHMRRVDEGYRPIDERTRAYIVNAWYLARYGMELGYEPAVEVAPHRLSRADMAQLVRLRNTHNTHWVTLRKNPPAFEHEGIAACVAANDFRPVLRLLRLTKLHPETTPTHPKWVRGPRGTRVLAWP